jgi:hypothetical protein
LDNYRKIFSEGINSDDDFSVISKGQWVNASNIRTFTTDSGATGRIENVGGTSLLFNTLPAGTNKCIGAVADDSKKWIVFKNWNSNGNHGIYCYSKADATTYTVLLNADVTGGLNFDKYSRIDSNCKIIGDLEYLTDNRNQPRRLNLKAAINAYQAGTFSDVTPYTLPVSQNVLYWIRRQPGLPPTAVKSTAGTINNFIKDEGFWFSYRYIYRDYETSTLSAWSTLQNYNTKDDTFDTITVTLPLLEKIEQDVQQIDLVVKFTSGISFVVKSWNKDIDSTAMTAHNSGTALSYAFLNDKTGVALDAAYSVKEFDSLPIYAKTIELAKNRSFMGNNVMGYDTPKTTSLSVEASSQSSSGVTGRWVKIVYSGGTHYFLDLGNSGFFDVTLQPNPLPYPTTEDYVSGMTFVAAGPADFGVYVSSHYSGWVGGIQYPGYTASITSAPTPAGLVGLRCFKSASSYKASISFLDFAGRKSGILTKDSLIVNIPGISYDHLDYTTGINWSLDNTSAEIPIWASYYSINVSKCLTVNSFIQLRVKGASYVTKDSTGAYVYTATTYAADQSGCAFDLTYFDQYNVGYQFTEGDIVKVFMSDGTTTAELKIIATDGKYVVTELKNLGTLNTSSEALLEIYTPHKQSTTEPEYEVAQIFPINNAGTSSRVYSTLAGQIQGDVTILKRNDTVVDYLTENMSPLDKFFFVWNTDHGRPNTIDTIGQQSLQDNIAFSDVLLQGTKVNGLSSFSALNVTDLEAENGSIQKLQLSNKQEADGTVMLAICEDETVSMYLGEQELFDTQGSAFIAQATGVIGSHKALKGSMGTSNPESVFEYNGLVFWWDIRNGSAVQYADNGLFPITTKKFVRPANLFSKKFSSLSSAAIEALGSNPFIIGGFDPYHKEVLFTIPSTETPPKGYLTDFPEVVYPYDIYDGQGKTLVYKNPADMWFGSMSFQAEQFVRMGNDLYSFKDGALYIHNQNTTTFYGQQFKSQLMFSVNPGAIHTFYSLGLESNKTPSWVHLRTEDPYTQSSDLPYVGVVDFVSKEGVIGAPLLRDRLSPNATGGYDAKQVTGDRLIGKALLVMLEYEFQTDTTPLQLRIVDVRNNVRVETFLP